MFHKLALSLVAVLFLSWNIAGISAMDQEFAEAIVKHHKQMLANATECKMKVGATEDDILVFMSRKSLPKTRTGACLLACLMERCELIQNGKFMEDMPKNIATFMMGPGDMIADLVGDVTKSCVTKLTAEDDSCNIALKMTQCGMDHVKKFQEVTKSM